MNNNNNEKVDPDINFNNTSNVHASFIATEQFANTMHDAKGISIIHINCRNLYAN